MTSPVVLGVTIAIAVWAVLGLVYINTKFEHNPDYASTYKELALSGPGIWIISTIIALLNAGTWVVALVIVLFNKKINLTEEKEL